MTKEIAVAPSEEAIAELRSSFPVTVGFTKTFLPRISFASQDQTEGKGKSLTVTAEAGTFFTEIQGADKEWTKEALGVSIEGTILYYRKQLKFYDSSDEKYTSSPVYDNDDESVILFKDKKQVDKGTPAELKARPQYQGVSAKGKPISKLEENRILYVLYKDAVYQMSLRGTSMYSFLTYARTTLPPSVLTKFNSEPKQNGATEWNQMTFEVVRPLDAEEVAVVMSKTKEIIEAVEMEKAFYSSKDEVKVDNDF
jgi:hypothetical protein